MEGPPFNQDSANTHTAIMSSEVKEDLLEIRADEKNPQKNPTTDEPPDTHDTMATSNKKERKPEEKTKDDVELGGTKKVKRKKKNRNNSAKLGGKSKEKPKPKKKGKSVTNNSCALELPADFKPYVEVIKVGRKGKRFTINCARIMKIIDDQGFLEVTHKLLGGKVTIVFQKKNMYLNRKPINPTDNLQRTLAPYMSMPVNCTGSSFATIAKGQSRKMTGVECHFQSWLVWFGEKPSKGDLENNKKKKVPKGNGWPKLPPFVKKGEFLWGNKLSTNCAKIVEMMDDRGLLKVSHESLEEDAYIYFVRDTVFTKMMPLNPGETIQSRLFDFRDSPFNCVARSLPSWTDGMRQRYFKDYKINYIAWQVWYGQNPTDPSKPGLISLIPYDALPGSKRKMNNDPNSAKRSNYLKDYWFGQEDWYGEDYWYRENGLYGEDWYRDDWSGQCGRDMYEAGDPHRYEQPPTGSSFGCNYNAYGLESTISGFEKGTTGLDFTVHQNSRLPRSNLSTQAILGNNNSQGSNSNTLRGISGNKYPQGSTSSILGGISGNKNHQSIQGSNCGTQDKQNFQGYNFGNHASNTGKPFNQRPQGPYWDNSQGFNSNNQDNNYQWNNYSIQDNHYSYAAQGNYSYSQGNYSYSQGNNSNNTGNHSNNTGNHSNNTSNRGNNTGYFTQSAASPWNTTGGQEWTGGYGSGGGGSGVG